MSTDPRHLYAVSLALALTAACRSQLQADGVKHTPDETTATTVAAPTTETAEQTPVAQAPLPPAAPSFADDMRGAYGFDGSFHVIADAAAGTTVQLFDNAACTGTPLAKGSAAELAAGITLPVSNQRLTVYANATDADGVASACSESFANYAQIVWTWLGGGTTQPYVYDYGSLGIGATTNFPRTRSAPSLWLADGKIWLFGGNSDFNWGDMNDMWTYEIATGKWTWVNGSQTPVGAYDNGTIDVEAAANTPQFRAANATWVGKDGRFYIFGGSAYGFGGMADLWRFDPKTVMWTRIGGSTAKNDFGSFGTKGVSAPTNLPSARFSSANWTDAAGKFWMFGGNTVAGYGNDLWRYDPDTREWTWINGSALGHQPGIYGVQGQAAADNIPGSRQASCTVQMKNGDVLIYGGAGYDEAGTVSGHLNDLWRYTPSTNQWTWLAGGKVIGAEPVYGTQGVAAATNTPGGRQAATCWTDSRDRLWLFGGESNTSGTMLERDDLWMYDVTAGQWTWVAGSQLATTNGIYGVQGQADAANFPGARHDFVMVKDDQGQAWFFAGFGFDTSSTTRAKLDDFWTFEIP